MTLVCAALGLLAGVLVTRHLHTDTGYWTQRIGRSRFRLANLPVGGELAGLAALLISSAPLGAAAAAMAIAAIGWRYVDPLPRA